MNRDFCSLIMKFTGTSFDRWPERYTKDEKRKKDMSAYRRSARFCSFGRLRQNAELDKFYSEMDDFTAQVNISFDNLNSVDPESETGVEDMLAAMDDLAAQFTVLADIEVPRQFSAVEDLADEAGENMTEAARLYREAYADEEYNENVASAALEYYNRAVKRLNYISLILQGEMPTDDSITIITENDAPGFKEDSEGNSDNYDNAGEPENTAEPSDTEPAE